MSAPGPEEKFGLSISVLRAQVVGKHGESNTPSNVAESSGIPLGLELKC
jgi:hypothetical protein